LVLRPGQRILQAHRCDAHRDHRRIERPAAIGYQSVCTGDQDTDSGEQFVLTGTIAFVINGTVMYATEATAPTRGQTIDWWFEGQTDSDTTLAGAQFLGQDVYY
jgi:hypothetical protein